MTKIRDELLTELLVGYEKPEDLLGSDGLLKRLTGALVEKALAADSGLRGRGTPCQNPGRHNTSRREFPSTWR